MKVIRKRRNCYAVLCVAGALLTAWFAVKLMGQTALIIGIASFLMLILLIRQNNLILDGSLILDNRIHTVPVASISIQGSRDGRDVEEIIISTFGILMGSRIYKWGSSGVHGVRLSAIRIDRARIYLTFGDQTKTFKMEVLHGMTDKQMMMDMKQRLKHETGVTAIISGWGDYQERCDEV